MERWLARLADTELIPELERVAKAKLACWLGLG